MPEASRDWYLEDFEPGVTYESPPHTITEEESVDFARRYDPLDFHVDPEGAKKSPFGGLIVPGFQTAALTWGMVQRTGMFEKCPIAGIGVDELRWLAPVRPGDTLRCRFTLIEARTSQSKPDRGTANFRYEMVNQDEATVLTLRILQLLRRRPAG